MRQDEDPGLAWGRFGGASRFAALLAEGLAAVSEVTVVLSLGAGAEILRSETAPHCDLPVTTYDCLFGSLLRVATVSVLVHRLTRRIAVCAMAGPLDLVMAGLAARLPAGLRQRLVRFVRLQGPAGRVLADLVVFLAAAAGRTLHRAAGRGQQLAGSDFAALLRPGDVLAAPWVYPGYAGLMADKQRRFGLRLAVLMHDIIPVMRLDWFPPVEIARFRTWLCLPLPSVNIPLAVSQATAAGRRPALRAPVRVIPLGTGFPPPDAARTPSGADTTALPPPGAMCCSSPPWTPARTTSCCYMSGAGCCRRCRRSRLRCWCSPGGPASS